MEHLLRIAEEQAGERCLPLVVERSDRSESVYLHLLRRETWFGVRIACHEPFYVCSADYQQVIVPGVLDDNCREHSGAYVRQLVLAGGHAVADPEEVAQAIEAARCERLDGMPGAAPDGTLWRWSAVAGCWYRADAERVSREIPRRIIAVDPESAAPPLLQLPAREQCAIRHRLNFRARWTWDERRGGQADRSVS